MRIAFVTYEFPPDTGKGGIGTYTKQMSQLLSENYFDVHIFAGSHYRSGSLVEDGYTLHRVLCTSPQDFTERVVESFTSVHTKSNFDCIESPEIHANALFIKDKFPHIPLIVRIHAPNQIVESFKKSYVPFFQKLRYFSGSLRRFKWDLGYWKSYNKYEDTDYLFTSKADYVVTPTEVMKKWVKENWHLPSAIYVSPNPVTIDCSYRDVEESTNEKKVLFYGRLNVLKGLVTATHAMKVILSNNKHWKWIVVGEDGPGPSGKGSMKDWMKKELKQVIGRVVFVGGVQHEEVPEYLNRSALVLIPSLFESFSYVCAETMSAGKAIVGSRNTGIGALIEDGADGFLANPFKVSEWIEKIQFLIDNESARKEIGSKARKKITQRAKDYSSTVDYYRNICSSLSKQD